MKHQSQVLDLYAYAGIRSSYRKEEIERYGKKVVDEAIKNAPKMKKFVKQVKAISKNPMVKLFDEISNNHADYAGWHGERVGGIQYIISNQ